MKMLQYTLIKNIEPEKIKPCPEDLAVEYNSSERKPDSKTYPALYPPILLRERKKYHVLIGKRHIDYYLQRKLLLPYGLSVERSGKKNCTDLTLPKKLLH